MANPFVLSSSSFSILFAEDKQLVVVACLGDRKFGFAARHRVSSGFSMYTLMGYAFGTVTIILIYFHITFHLALLIPYFYLFIHLLEGNLDPEPLLLCSLS